MLARRARARTRMSSTQVVCQDAESSAESVQVSHGRPARPATDTCQVPGDLVPSSAAAPWCLFPSPKSAACPAGCAHSMRLVAPGTFARHLLTPDRHAASTNKHGKVKHCNSSADQDRISCLPRRQLWFLRPSQTNRHITLPARSTSVYDFFSRWACRPAST